VVLERALLQDWLERGWSLERIAREVDRHPSTVAYWARKYGLRSQGAERFAARGAPDRDLLTRLAAQGATLSEMAGACDRSIATIRHWLGRWEIERAPRPSLRRPLDPESAPRVIELNCKRHGNTEFVLEGRGYYRCKRCRQEQVARRRRRVKLLLVAEAGGRCALCGYDRCPAALQFHHLDPGQKAFAVSMRGVTRGIEAARAEAKKCALLCANCHAEVEAGYRILDSGLGRAA
jgi:hypothetical protein